MSTLVPPVPMEVSPQERGLAVAVLREAGQAEVGRSFPGTRIWLCHSKAQKWGVCEGPAQVLQQHKIWIDPLWREVQLCQGQAGSTPALHVPPSLV